MGFKQNAKDGGSVLAWSIAGLLGLAVLVVVAIYVFGAIGQGTADFRGETGAKNQTNGSGQYRVAKYDSFHDQCNAIVAAMQNIQIASQATDANTPNTYDNVNLTAQKRQLNDLIASYNSDASKTATAGQFRDSNLPYHIDANTEPSCG